MRCLATLAALTLLVLTEAGQPASFARSATTSPRFKAAPCPFRVGAGLIEGKDVTCGYLTVPENRTATDRRSIQIAVAIFSPRGPSPAPDPLVYLHGGPGGAIVAALGPTITAENANASVGRHGLVLVDQRGSGLSRPSLDCPEVADATFRAYERQLPATQQRQAVDQAVRACRTRLIRAGIDLDAYNTVENAADIADMRTALGYTAIDLYGGSYGTRLALQVVRDHPQGIRSVILDAVADPTFDEFTDAIPNAWRALSLVFKECAAAPACSARYPRLEQTFGQLVGRLQARPITISAYVPLRRRSYGFRVDGATFEQLLMAALYSSALIPRVPQLIADTARGDYTPLVQAASATVLRQVPGQGRGAYLSAECADDQATATPERVAARAAVLPAAIRAAAVAERVDVLAQCRIWGVRSVAPANRLLFRSAIPTLLLNGQYDPRTPSDPAARLARGFARGYFLIFPGRGHGVWHTGACPDGIVAAFLDHPDRRPAVACIARMPPAFQ